MIDGPSLIALPSMMGYCPQSLKAYYADRTWQIRFLYGSA